MLTRGPFAPVPGGTRQEDRWARALAPDWAPVDGRTLPDLLDAACRTASLITYYDLDNRPAGDWVAFLTREPAITLAAIAATDLRFEEQRLLALDERARAARDVASKRAHLVTLFDAALEVPRQVDRWHRGAQVWALDAGEISWRQAVRNAIATALGPGVRQLRAYDLGAGSPHALGASLDLDFSGFSREWDLAGVSADDSIYEGASILERLDRAVAHVLPIWRSMADHLANWGAAARPGLARALDGDGRMQPHTALLVAFARLFASVQRTLNTLGARRTDYYYRTILREGPRPAVPDTVAVGFRCAPAQPPAGVVVPAGTAVAAGKDRSGRSIVYESARALTVTPAALARVLALRVVPADPAIGAGADLPGRVVAREIPAADGAAAGWASFAPADDAPAAIGFAVAAPVLALSGGERRIRVDIRHDPHSPSARRLLETVQQQTGADQAAILDRVLAEAFSLTVSISAGWLPVDGYTVAGPADRRQNMFSLQFVLPAAAPAVVPAVDGPGAGQHPVLRVHLRQEPVVIEGPAGECAIAPLAALSSMRVTGVRLHVTVGGLPGATMFNTDGQVDPARPFAAFGAVPAVGSSLRIRHPELFAKQVDHLSIRISWFDLPASRAGFAGHYRQYLIDPDGTLRDRLFDNRSFRVAASVERPGAWALAPAADALYLFRTSMDDSVPAPADPLAPATAFELPAAAIPAPAGNQPSDGAIRIELRQPPYAFGNTLYAPNAVHAARQGLPNGAASEACRADFAVLEETRQRLQRLLDGSGSGRAPRLRALSPASWPRRAGRHLRGAYASATGTWRAYVTADAGRDASPEWVVRSQYAGGDDAGVEVSEDEDTYRRTARATLRTSVSSLLDTAAGCLRECVRGSERMEARVADWRQRLDRADRGAAPLRLAALRSLHLELSRAEHGTDAPASVLTRCGAVLQAASWVLDCDLDTDQLDGRYTRSVRTNLRTCIGRLQSLYDASVASCAGAGAGDPSRALPNPPYVPQIGGIALDYTAQGPAEFYHLLPLGGWHEPPADRSGPPTLIPRFAHACSLYIGLTGAEAAQTLHLFVRVASRSAAEAWGRGTTWECLSGDRWLPLDVPAAHDGTNGLRHSGTLALVLPATAETKQTLLPAGYRWLRASWREDRGGHPGVLGILPHAVPAVRRLTGADEDLEEPLPPRRVAALLTPLRGIAAVDQPMPSEGGRPTESERAFQTRLSERLRHRGRAVTGWDYERLILEQFPMIWAARVLPARRRRPGEPSGSTGPGHVRIVVVPGPACHDVADREAPAAGVERLAAIEAALARAAGAAVRCHVLNPIYVRVRVSAVIQWRGAADPHAACRDLDAALVEYLMPWTHPGSDRAYWTEPELAHFIRSRPGVACIESLAVALEQTDAAAREPERCVPTSAPAHDVRSSTTAPAALVDGY